MKARFRKATWLVGAAALVAIVFAPSAMASSIVDASKTATGHWTRTFEWDIEKSVTPASHDMQTGQSGTSTYTVTVTKSAGADLIWVDGQVCVTNVGETDTESLTIRDRVQANTGSGFPPGQFIADVMLDLSANPVLSPDETHCYAYSIPLTPVAGAVAYRNNAAVRVTNDPRCSDDDPTTAPGCNPGDPFGPNVVAEFNLPASPTLINNAINVDDTNPAGDAGPFSSTTSYSYDRTFTCDGDEGQHDNTATIVETGQSDNASVTVTCTPPPSVCTYTKGWYRNNGSDTVIAVDGRTKAQAQAIFGATPGKPGGVTWQGGNNTLNLYQQLLAALNNLGGDANEDAGPAAVDAAIDEAQAGTGGTGLNITTTLTQAQVSSLIDTLSAFNEGKFAGFPHCD